MTQKIFKSAEYEHQMFAIIAHCLWMCYSEVILTEKKKKKKDNDAIFSNELLKAVTQPTPLCYNIFVQVIKPFILAMAMR